MTPGAWVPSSWWSLQSSSHGLALPLADDGGACGSGEAQFISQGAGIRCDPPV